VTQVDPGGLQRWEPVLQSPVAVALLLLAGFLVVSSSLLVVVRELWRENKEKDAVIRQLMDGRRDIDVALSDVRKVQKLIRSTLDAGD
jgi:hypothetical protein